MKSFYTLGMFLLIICSVLLGCTHFVTIDEEADKVKIGVLLADDGLGDHSFNDTAFIGLMKARDELGIEFDYRDLTLASSFKDGLQQLIEEDFDLIIGLGYTMQEDFMAIATENPEQLFMYIDEEIHLPNVTSVTFNEYEGSFLAGVVAGFKTETNSIGFIGGMQAPVIERFKNGFVDGVKSINPDARVTVTYANSFSAPDIGSEIVSNLVKNENVDIVFPAAGYTGLGALEQAVQSEIYAIGVDSDQFYLAEKAVITSMLKNVDVAIYTAVEELVETGTLASQHMELGLLEDGVELSQVRLLSLTEQEEEQLEKIKKRLMIQSQAAIELEE